MKYYSKKITCLLLAICMILAGITYDPTITSAISLENLTKEPGLFDPDDKLTMHVGDMINLRYKTGTNRYVTGDYTWASSNSQIVSVELFENGQNTIARTRAIAAGTADIICSKDGSPDLKMTVTVINTAPDLTVNARATSVKYASKWRALIGIDGTYERVEKEKILKRINQIRLEACQKGYPLPGDPKKKMTADDYVPIKWSSDLEWIAQIRAAEATVRREHDRPNGRTNFSVTHNGVMPEAETLAWNYNGIMDGIEQWYDEKDDWVKQNLKKTTGHYTCMIDPNFNYVGIGGFVKKSGGWHGIAGEFVSKAGAANSIYEDIRETVYRDNYIDRDQKYYDESLYNDGLDSDQVFSIEHTIPDNPDGLDSLEDMDRLYGAKTVEELAELADKDGLKLPEEQSDLKGRTIQMVEVISTRLGAEKFDAPKSIKKGKTQQLFVTRTVYDDAVGIVLDVKWKSSDDSVISIKKDGTITALKTGKATITAEFKDKALKKTISVKK